MASRHRSILGAVVAVLVLVLALAVAQVAPGDTPSPRWLVVSAHPEGAGAAQLFRVQATGGSFEQITTGSKPATSPSFSPDGTRVVFTRLGSGIFAVNLDGTGLRRLTSHVRDSSPAWSPNGKQVAFLRPFRRQWYVYVMSASGSGQHRLPQGPPAGRPTWAGNSQGIYAPSAGDLVLMDPRTGRIRKYFGVTLDIQVSQSATVSPDAQQVAYVGPRLSTGPEDCGEGPCPQFGLYLARLPAPHRTRRIANDTGPAGWSPDARTLAYVSQGALTLRQVSTGGTTRITPAPHILTGDSPPAWQPR